MVKAIVDIDNNANRIINIVKAKEDLKDKSQAINLILNLYGEQLLEPELKPDFIKKILRAKKEKSVEIKDWNKHFGLRK